MKARWAVLAVSVSVAVSLGGQAAALSCPRPDVRTSFGAASESDATYVLAVGRLTLFEGVRLPPPPETGEDPTPYALRAVFDGHLASLDGFDDPARFGLMVEVGCDGPSCGSVPLDDADRLFFVERRPAGDVTRNVLVEGPCPRWSMPATPETVEGALACLRGDEACGREGLR